MLPSADLTGVLLREVEQALVARQVVLRLGRPAGLVHVDRDVAVDLGMVRVRRRVRAGVDVERQEAVVRDELAALERRDGRAATP